ncbi:MAG: hypothetical protein PGN26_14530 [Xylophilus ampelinus]
MAAKTPTAPRTATAPNASAPEPGAEPTSTVPNGRGENVEVPDAELNTAADPKTANGDVARKVAGIAPSATAEQVLANGGVDTIDHSVDGANAPDIPAEPDAAAVDAQATGKPVAGRVLAAVTIAGVRYQPNEVITGLPGSLAKQHADSVDSHPDAVAYARSQGFPERAYADGLQPAA